MFFLFSFSMGPLNDIYDRLSDRTDSGYLVFSIKFSKGLNLDKMRVIYDFLTRLLVVILA